MLIFITKLPEILTESNEYHITKQPTITTTVTEPPNINSTRLDIAAFSSRCLTKGGLSFEFMFRVFGFSEYHVKISLPVIERWETDAAHNKPCLRCGYDTSMKPLLPILSSAIVDKFEVEAFVADAREESQPIWIDYKVKLKSLNPSSITTESKLKKEVEIFTSLLKDDDSKIENYVFRLVVHVESTRINDSVAYPKKVIVYTKQFRLKQEGDTLTTVEIE
ncbi:hypothetical protein CDIK_0364 [Cucumispora dikerogammari]|nr:hypothetical protein CDIK_0364 [Cucumispora dikerogammari]